MRNWCVVMLLLLCSGIFSGNIYAVEKARGQDGVPFKRDAYLHYLQGLIHEREGRFEEALDEYALTIRMDPQASFVHRILSTLNVRIGRLDAALQAIERIQEIEKDNPDTYFLAGSIYLLKGDVEKAKESFRQVITLDPENKDALLYLAGMTADENVESSIKYLEEYLQLDPHSPDVHYEIGVIFAKRKSTFSRAQKHLTRAIELDNGFYSAYLALAQLYEKKKEYKRSIPYYERCLEIKPGNDLLQVHLGIVYVQVGDIEKANRMYTRISEGSPDDFGFLVWLGVMAEEKKEWPKVIAYLEEAFKKEKNVKSLLRLSYYYIQIGKKKKAVQLLLEAKAANPDDIQVRYLLAFGLQEQGAFPEAISELKEIIRRDNTFIDAHFQLGVIYEQLGSFEKAIPSFYRVLAIRPDHAPSANYLAYSFADRNIRMDEAEKLVRIALKAEPENPAYLDTLGWIYYRQGKYPEALAELSKAAAGAEDPIIKEHLGDAHWAMGLIAEGDAAIKQAWYLWRESLQMDTNNKHLKKKIKQREKKGSSFASRIHDLQDAFLDNQKKIRNLSGLFTLRGSYDGRKFRIRGVLYYRQPDDVRIDLVGPLLTPLCSLFFDGQHVRVRPPGSLDQLFPGSSSDILETILHSMADYLSGSISSSLVHPGIVWHASGRNIILTDNTVHAVQSKKSGMIRAIDYYLKSGEKINIRIKHSTISENIYVPAQMHFKVHAQNLKLHIKFKGMKINQSIKESIFDAP